jgi:hypothetical protein
MKGRRENWRQMGTKNGNDVVYMVDIFYIHI